jgi:hypothetical protein
LPWSVVNVRSSLCAWKPMPQKASSSQLMGRSFPIVIQDPNAKPFRNVPDSALPYRSPWEPGPDQADCQRSLQKEIVPHIHRTPFLPDASVQQSPRNCLKSARPGYFCQHLGLPAEKCRIIHEF